MIGVLEAGAIIMRGTTKGCTLELVAPLAAALLAACGGPPAGTTLVVSGSGVGAEAEALRRQVARFQASHPELVVTLRPSPDAADERHQAYVQWLAAGVPEPDVLQLDVIWTAEMAAAGWLLPLDGFAPDLGDVFPAARSAATFRGRTFGVPWFVDAGMLYWRKDLLTGPPTAIDDLVSAAARGRAAGAPQGLALELARYEGLVTVFLELCGAFGGELVDGSGAVLVDSEASVRALEWLRRALADGTVPEAALGWQEEQARLAFEDGRVPLMRNWPYAFALVARPPSRVAGKVGIAPMPAAPGGRPTAALGGAQLAINAHTRNPAAAWALVDYLTRPEQLLERAVITGELPPRESLFDDPALRAAVPLPLDEAREVLRAAVPRPVTPVYGEYSRALQVHLHRALTGQEEPRAALASAAREMRAAQDRLSAPPPEPGSGQRAVLLLLALGIAAGLVRLARGAPAAWRAVRDADRLGLAFVAPALGLVALVTVFPLVVTLGDSFFAHDLALPWRGHSFVGLANYRAALADERFWAALGHTALFVVVTVALELVLGLSFALLLDAVPRVRALARVGVLVPWALPTVVAALLWRFLFAGDTGLVNALLDAVGHAPVSWLTSPRAAWVPVILADVWKTTPFVALLLLAGLQGIDPSLHEAARVDGAGPLARLFWVTLPLLRPAFLVALVFRTIDALRVFDLVYVLTGGGPGTATEPLAQYAFTTLLVELRFGFGSALSVIIFILSFVLALAYVRLLSRGALA